MPIYAASDLLINLNIWQENEPQCQIFYVNKFNIKRTIFREAAASLVVANFSFHRAEKTCGYDP